MVRNTPSLESPILPPNALADALAHIPSLGRPRHAHWSPAAKDAAPLLVPVWEIDVLERGKHECLCWDEFYLLLNWLLI